MILDEKNCAPKKCHYNFKDVFETCIGLKTSLTNFLNDKINFFLVKSHGVILDSILFAQSYISLF